MPTISWAQERLANGELLEYEDLRANHYSAKCQPRDIRITKGEDSPNNMELIAIDTRIGQGYPAIGAARNLLH